MCQCTGTHLYMYTAVRATLLLRAACCWLVRLGAGGRASTASLHDAVQPKPLGAQHPPVASACGCPPIASDAMRRGLTRARFCPAAAVAPLARLAWAARHERAVHCCSRHRAQLASCASTSLTLCCVLQGLSAECACRVWCALLHHSARCLALLGVRISATLCALRAAPAAAAWPLRY